MSELQTEDGVAAPEVENLDTGADLAPASEEQHETNVQVDEEAKKQEAIQKTINKKTFEAKQAERERDAAVARAEALEDAERQRQAATVGAIPPIPDQYDEDFEQKLAVRDQAIAAKAQFDANQTAILQNQQNQQQQDLQQRQDQLTKSTQSYTSRAVELGINQEELQAAGSIVAQCGMSDDLVMHILSDTDGPLITKYLAANPHEGFELATMSPFAVGTHLDGIRAKAAALKPKQSNAPDPADTLQGNGVNPELGKYPNLKGTVYS